MKWRYQHPELEIEELEYADILCGSVEWEEEDPGENYTEPIS